MEPYVKLAAWDTAAHWKVGIVTVVVQILIAIHVQTSGITGIITMDLLDLD